MSDGQKVVFLIIIRKRESFHKDTPDFNILMRGLLFNGYLKRQEAHNRYFAKIISSQG